MINKSYKYETCCVNAKGEDISEMTASSIDITYRTFFRHVDLQEAIEALGNFYERDPRRGLTLKDDWHVAYCKGKYRGKPCYYLVHSGIEYIWIERRDHGDTRTP
jgi:hypothetical protein